MRVDRRFVVVISLSLAWAAVVAGVFYRAASGAVGRPKAEEAKPVVVASVALPAGGMIGRESVKLRMMPASAVPAGSFTRVEDVLERPVISGIEAEEPVVEARLAVKGSGAGLAPMIPSGMRGISVRVNDVAGVAGFALPGMRVDVLFTSRPGGRADPVTRTVLQDVQVLSAGQTTQADVRSQPVVVPVVTLLVNPRQAEVLTLANEEGHIQLVLRNSTDRKIEPTGESTTRDIFRESAPPVRVREVPGRRSPPRVETAAIAPPAAAPPEKSVAAHQNEVEVIHGKVKTVESFAGGTGAQ